MKVNAEMLVKAEEYIAEYDPARVPEEIFLSFETIAKVHRKFRGYWKKNKTGKFKRGMKRSERQMIRRKIFIEWYVSTNPDKTTQRCLEDLSEILFLSLKRVEIIHLYS